MAFALRSGLMTTDAYMVRDKSAMPAVLQGLIFQAVGKGLTWCCWTDKSRTWLLTGDMPLHLSRVRGTPVLDVRLYGEEGQLKDSGSWFLDEEGQWRRGAEPGRPDSAH